MRSIRHIMLSIGAVFVVGLFTHAAKLDAQTEAPLGLWVSESVTGTSLKGKLVVVRNGAEWSARISSVESRFRLNGDSVRFRFPGELGEFRGRRFSDGLAWHLGTTKAGAKTYRNYGMGGNGGQLVMVIPDLDLAWCSPPETTVTMESGDGSVMTWCRTRSSRG